MVRQKPFDKRTATTFTLVHRPQHDPLINDPDAPSQLLAETTSQKKTNKKIKERGDLEEEFGIKVKGGQIRSNEGEAAEHGVFYDDSDYDYMQHLREIGTGGGETVWVESNKQEPSKGKAKQSLEDALRESSLGDETQSVGGASYWTGTSSRAPERAAFEKQQDVPDALQGFQPDMDPRLREVLEALEDDAYVDDDEELFKDIRGDGEEVDQYDWEEQGLYVDDDEGWESDDTTKPAKEFKATPAAAALPAPAAPADPVGDLPQATPDSGSADGPPPADGVPPADIPDSDDFMTNFAQYKREKAVQDSAEHKLNQVAPSQSGFSTNTGMTKGKRRKGALTNPSAFSMTSSSIARTEQLSTLDARFDKLAESYMSEIPEDDEFMDETMSAMSGVTGMSRQTAKTARTNATRSAWGGSQVSNAPSLITGSAFNGVMDDFLGGTGKGRRRIKKGGSAGMQGETGLDQLDEVRRGLGPARVGSRYKT